MPKLEDSPIQINAGDDRLVSRFVPFASSDSFRLGRNDNEEIFRINLDSGEITINSKYSTSEGAKAFWKAVIALRPLYPITINAGLISRLLPFSDSFRLVNGNEEICRITFDDGETTINPKYSASEAAKVFWDAVIA